MEGDESLIGFLVLSGFTYQEACEFLYPDFECDEEGN